MADYVLSGKIFPSGGLSFEKRSELSVFAARRAIEHEFYINFGVIALDYLRRRSMPELMKTLEADFYSGASPYLLFSLHDSPAWDECDRLYGERMRFCWSESDKVKCDAIEKEFNLTGTRDLQLFFCELLEREDVDHIELVAMPNHGYVPNYVTEAVVEAEEYRSFMWSLYPDAVRLTIVRHKTV